MARQIHQVGVLKNVLTGTELVEIQDGTGFGSSKRTTVQAIANLVGSLTAPVTSVQGRFGDVVLDQTDVGLPNVDNTSDVNKPVSTAQQAALDLKADIAGQDFTGDISAPNITIAGNINVGYAYENGFRLISADSIAMYVDNRVNALLGNDVPIEPITTGVIGVVIGDRNNPIPTDTYTWARIPFRCRILKATLLCEPSGNFAIDVRRGRFEDWPLQAEDSICGGNIPQIVEGTKYEDDTLIGWDVELFKDDLLTFRVVSGVAVTFAYLVLDIVR